MDFNSKIFNVKSKMNKNNEIKIKNIFIIIIILFSFACENNYYKKKEEKFIGKIVSIHVLKDILDKWMIRHFRKINLIISIT